MEIFSVSERNVVKFSLFKFVKSKKWIVQYGVIGLLSFVIGLVCAEPFLRSVFRLNTAVVNRFDFFSSQRDKGLLSQFDAVNWRKELPQEPTALELGMQVSSALRMHAIQRFLQATNEIERFQLLDIISKAPSPELQANAIQLASDPSNAWAGFALLSRLPPSEASKSLILDALFNEQNANVLGWVLRGFFRPPVPEPQLSKSVVPRLHALTQHKNANVRAASIQRLAEWDKAMHEFPGDVVRLLADDDSEVRTAAMGAVSIAGLRTPSVKQRFVQILKNAKESDLARKVAFMNLPDFDLNEEEYVAYQNYKKEFQIE